MACKGAVYAESERAKQMTPMLEGVMHLCLDNAYSGTRFSLRNHAMECRDSGRCIPLDACMGPR